MKRQKADPRQLSFVFESLDEPRAPDVGASGGGAGPETFSEAFLPSFETPAPQPPAPPQTTGRKDGEASAERKVEREEGAPISDIPDSGMPAALAAVHRAKFSLSGPDPGLTALCAGWLLGVDSALAPLAKKLTVIWNRKFTSAAGVARYGPNRIELNPALVKFEGEVERTLRHELAHLVARFRNPKKKIQPHGREWRMACADLGIPGEPIYHSLPFESRRRRRKHAYRCGGCSQVITRVRPLKGHCACYTCCKKFNSGRYDSRFRLEKVPLPADADA